MLVAHGRDFLEPQEFDHCLRDAERNYFHYLAKYACARHRKSSEFWEYHRNGLGGHQLFAWLASSGKMDPWGFA